MFYHSHIINGRIISHSHFYKTSSSSNKTPFQSHSHTSDYLTFIKALDENSWCKPNLLSVPQFIKTTDYFQNSFFVSNIISDNYTLQKLRAPPTVL